MKIESLESENSAEMQYPGHKTCRIVPNSSASGVHKMKNGVPNASKIHNSCRCIVIFYPLKLFSETTPFYLEISTVSIWEHEQSLTQVPPDRGFGARFVSSNAEGAYDNSFVPILHNMNSEYKINKTTARNENYNMSFVVRNFLWYPIRPQK